MRKGFVIVTKEPQRVGTILDFYDDGIEVDFGDRTSVIQTDKIDWTKTAVLQTIAVLDKLIKIYGQPKPSVRETPITEEELKLPTTPQMPFVERFPARPPGFPSELEVPKPTLESLVELDKALVRMLDKIERLVSKRAEVQAELENFNQKVKELRTISKEFEEQIRKEVLDVAAQLQKNLEGSEELASFFGKYRDKVLQLIRWIKIETVEPPAETLLEELLKIIKEEAPRKFDRITQRLEQIKNDITQKSEELSSYLAIAPLGSIKGYKTAQVLETVKGWIRKLWDWIKGVYRSVVRWGSEIQNILDETIETYTDLERITKEIL